MRTVRLALLLGVIAAGLACSIDDSIVEGKHCYVGSIDPETSCIQGYECKCDNGQCLCVKIETLRQPQNVSVELKSELDPSRALLRRLGLTPP